MSIRDDVAAAARYIEWREITGYSGGLVEGLEEWRRDLRDDALRELVTSTAPPEVRLAALESILDES